MFSLPTCFYISAASEFCPPFPLVCVLWRLPVLSFPFLPPFTTNPPADGRASLSLDLLEVSSCYTGVFPSHCCKVLVHREP